MDADRFDALSRALSTGHTRRRLNRLLSGLSLGGVIWAGTAQAALAALRKGGTACTKGSQCKTGTCLRNRTCSCSQTFPTCMQSVNRCKQATCDFATKRCVISNKAPGTACPIAHGTGLCADGVCAVATCEVGFGNCDGRANTGCETNTQSDLNHCGDCATICPSGTFGQACVNGGCYKTCAGTANDCTVCAPDCQCATLPSGEKLCYDAATACSSQSTAACPTGACPSPGEVCVSGLACCGRSGKFCVRPCPDAP